MRYSLGVLLLAFTAAGIVSADVGTIATESQPGKVSVAESVRTFATITDIDAKTRNVKLKGPLGNVVDVVAGPEVQNFAQLKVGDQVNMEFVEALTLELKKGGGLVVQRTEQGGSAHAKPGERPQGQMGRQVVIVADVVGLDPTRQVVVLRGPQRVVELRVRDPQQFKLIALGDQVEATFLQALALAVEPVTKK